MKKHFAKPMLIICLLSMFMFAGCTSKAGSSTAGQYPIAVAWNDISYGLSVTEISKDELGKQLGEIKRKKEPMPIENGDANDTPVGSKLFEIKGVDAKEAIAVEINGKAYKATKIGLLK